LPYRVAEPPDGRLDPRGVCWEARPVYPALVRLAVGLCYPIGRKVR